MIPAKPGDGWQPIKTAPRDGTFVWVWAAPRDTLPGFVELARYHEDAGWCVDELRVVTLWQPCEIPPPPRNKRDEPHAPQVKQTCPKCGNPDGNRITVWIKEIEPYSHKTHTGTVRREGWKCELCGTQWREGAAARLNSP